MSKEILQVSTDELQETKYQNDRNMVSQNYDKQKIRCLNFVMRFTMKIKKKFQHGVNEHELRMTREKSRRKMVGIKS